MRNVQKSVLRIRISVQRPPAGHCDENRVRVGIVTCNGIRCLRARTRLDIVKGQMAMGFLTVLSLDVEDDVGKSLYRRSLDLDRLDPASDQAALAGHSASITYLGLG